MKQSDGIDELVSVMSVMFLIACPPVIWVCLSKAFKCLKNKDFGDAFINCLVVASFSAVFYMHIGDALQGWLYP